MRAHTCVAFTFVAALATRLPAQMPVTVSGTEQFVVKVRSNGVDYRVDEWKLPGLDTMTVRPPVLRHHRTD